MNTLEDWYEAIDASMFHDAIKSRLRESVSKLLNSGLPVILNLEHLSKLIGFDKSYIAKMAFASELYYNSFKMKKKRGGARIISAPCDDLKYVQRWLKRSIIDRVNKHPNVHGFVSERSILTNANAHLGARYVLNIDIKDYFPSIGSKRIIKVFHDLGYLPKVSVVLASLCCANRCLPQGAPTSPGLANIVSRGMDEEIYKVCNSVNYIYTRYADDIAISSKEEIRQDCVVLIHSAINRCGFLLNHAKTRMYKNEGKCVITGLNISSGVSRVGRKYRRELKKELYHIQTKGLFSHMKKMKLTDPMYIKRIQGKLDFVRSIEPNFLIGYTLPKL